MAESGEFSSLGTEGDMLCCAVCLEEYEDPRALPCLHTFCYKCLVELSMGGGGEGEGPSDVTLQVAALKLEFSSYMSASSVPKQLDVIRCPLCSEQHPIPKDKGVAGFRKDFRINQLQQQKSREDDSTLKGMNLDDLEAAPEVCPVHLGEKLMYHCETCKSDVCEKCWGISHDSHVVKLLSKKVNDAKEALQHAMDDSIKQITSQVDLLTKAKDKFTAESGSIQSALQKRYTELQTMLQRHQEQSVQEFEMRSKMQDKKMADELQSLVTLKETFLQIKGGIQNENLPQTSKAFRKYTTMQSKMAQMGEERSNWSFSYTIGHWTERALTEEFLKALEVNYQEEVLGRKIEGGASRTKRAKTRGKQGKKETGPKQPKQGKAKEGKSEAVNSPSDIQKAEVNLTWQSFLAQKKPNIECMVATKGDEVFVATTEKYLGFKTSPPKQLFDRDLQNESVDGVAMVTSKAGNVDFLVKLDSKRNSIKFLSSKGKTNPYDFVSKFLNIKKDIKLLASAGQYVGYSYLEQHKVHVGFLEVENETPDVTDFGVPVEVPFTRVRSMCTYVSKGKGYPVLVCANAFQAGKTDKSENALVGMTKQIVHWKVTFAEFDSQESNFDLRGIACDRDNIFVLNSRAHVIYNVSKNGSCLSKVNIVGAPPKYRLSSPDSICIDPHTKSVYIAHVKDVVSKFTY